MKMTREILDGLVGVPREKLIRYPVDGSLGLYIQVTKTGAVSWVYRFRSKKRVAERSYTIGKYPEWSIKRAVAEFERLRIEVRDGKDPAGYIRDSLVPRKVGRARNIREGKAIEEAILAARHPVVPPEPVPAPPEPPPTLREVAEAFYEKHVKVNNRPSFVKQQRWRLDKYILPQLGDRPIDQVTAVVVTRHLDEIAEKTPINANRVMTTLRKMFGWASRRYNAVANMANPCIGHEPEPEEPVQTRLLEEDVRRLGEAWRISKDPRKFACILPLLTGCRRGVVVHLNDAESSKEEGVLRFPKDLDGLKGTQIVYVPTVAWPILDKIAKKGITPETLAKSWAKLREEAKIECSIHDLRRSFVSFGVDLGFSPDLLSAILGHSQGKKKLQETYMVPADKKVPADKTLAGIAEKIGKHIATLLSLRESRAGRKPAKGNESGQATREYSRLLS
jgi:hypothetical protein